MTRHAARVATPLTLADLQADIGALRRIVEERLPAPLPAREWWTVEETAERTRYSPQAVRGWARGPFHVGTRRGPRGPWQIDVGALRRMFLARFGQVPVALR
jgi:hypothetical protein